MAVDTASTAPIIDLADIVKTYRVHDAFGRARPFNAVDGVSMTVGQGEVFGLLGRNGAGKTTLLKVMAGLLAPDGGRGRVLGYDIAADHKAIRASVSLVAPTADVGIDNNLTVRQNLEFWAVVYNVDPSIRGARIDEMLGFLGLKEFATYWPMSISAGLRQRLAIARSLLVRNPLLFLDEPTVKLDAPGAHAVRDFIRRINRDFGITVILTTHLIFEAEELCDRVAVMDKGRLIGCDEVGRLRKRLRQYDSCTITCDPVPAQLQQEIGGLGEVVACEYRQGVLELTAENLELVLFQTLSMLRRRRISIRAVKSLQPTLEDVFVSMVES